MSEYYETRLNYSHEYKKKCWDMANGLQAVDGLETSEYLKELSQEEIEGNLTNAEIEQLLYKKYMNETVEEKESRVKEADIVSNRIVELLSEPGFSFAPVTLKYIHKKLFEGIYDHAGVFRSHNLSKDEPVLLGRSVKYANYGMIDDTFQYDFEIEKKKPYSLLSQDEVLNRIAVFSSSVWQVHPFYEGNTRTTAVFMEKYLNFLGFQVDNELFLENSQYYRNALVRSNFADYKNNVFPTMDFLEKFYENLLFQGKNILKNRDMIVSSYISKIPKKR